MPTENEQKSGGPSIDLKSSGEAASKSARSSMYPFWSRLYTSILASTQNVVKEPPPSATEIVALGTNKPIAKPTVSADESPFMTIANMCSKVTLTSLTITIGTHPLYSFIINNQAGQKFSKLAILGVMSRSLPSKLVEGQMKGAVSVTGKNISQTPAELLASASLLESSEQTSIEAEKGHDFKGLLNGKWGSLILSPIFLTPVFSQLDLLFTSAASNRSKLAGFGVNSFNNTLYNNWKLVSIAYPIRSLASAVTFGSVLVGSDRMNSALSATGYFNERSAAFVGGGMMGLISCIFTHPLSEAADHLLKKTTLDKVNNLTTPNSYSFFRNEVLPLIRQQGWFASTAQFYGSTFKGRLFPKMLSTATTFALLQFMTQELNDKKPITSIITMMMGEFCDKERNRDDSCERSIRNPFK